MPVYNAENYLIEAIGSILEQTYENFELLIINDGSTDASANIIDYYVSFDSRIVHVKNDNQGISRSLNHGIQISRGKYIARMDSDDISMPKRLEEQVKFMENNVDVGICGTWASLFGEIKSGQSIRHPIEDAELKVLLLFSVCFVHPTVMIRSDVLSSTNIKYDINYPSAQDYNMWVRLKNHTKFANIPLVLLKYRVTSHSVSSTANADGSSVRFNLISNSFESVLEELDITLDLKERERHYKLGLNSRLRDGDFNLESLPTLIYTILKNNAQYSLYNSSLLRRFLSEKYAYAVIFKMLSGTSFQFSSVCASLFLEGGRLVLLREINRRFRMLVASIPKLKW